MMAKLHHPNIIQFLACCFDPFVCLVLELAAKGSLRGLLGPKTFSFAWSKHASMVLDMARGLHYLVRLSHSRTRRRVDLNHISLSLTHTSLRSTRLRTPSSTVTSSPTT